MATTSPNGIRVLHIDDEPGFADMVATFLEQQNPRLDVEPITHPQEALDQFAQYGYDAIISDFDMPQMTGLEVLDSIRESHPAVPFILYTGKGSEEIASEAITRGVTDYMQKTTGTEHYEVLANRVMNAVERSIAEQSARVARDRFQSLFDHAHDAMIIADDEGQYLEVNTAACELLGRSKSELLGRTAADFTVEDFDFSTAWETFKSADAERGLYPVQRPDGEIRVAEYAATTNIRPGEHLSILRDVTEQQKIEEQAKLERARLHEFAGVLTHDLKNPVMVARGHLDLLMDGSVTDAQRTHTEAIEDAIDRIEDVIDDVLAISRTEVAAADQTAVSLADVGDAVWERVGQSAAHADIETDLILSANKNHVERLLTNLFRNTLEHAGPAVRVRLGTLADDTGFYIEDDGPGIPPEERDAVFDWQHSTKDGGTGIGLRSVQQIVDAEGWAITITSGQLGGARFEIRGVEIAE